MKELFSVFKTAGPDLGRAFAVFLVAGILEVGGGFLVWRWLREGQLPWYGIAGAAMLALYGAAATYSPYPFGRAYAAYGGVFVLLSIVWGMSFDHFRPDRQDWFGAAIILAGILVMSWGTGR